MARVKLHAPVRTPVASQPLLDTRALLDVSVTERAAFRECRRRWFLETIDNLEPVGPTTALEFGTGVHAALESYYLGGQTEEAMESGWAGWLKAMKEGTDAGEDWSELLDMVELGEIMLANYQVFDPLSRIQLGKVVNVEGITPEGVDPLPDEGPKGYSEEARVTRHESGRFQVPIVDPETKQPIERGGKVPQLTGRLDIITERKTGYWPVDHKTAASPHNDRGLDFDDQVTGYCYIMWRLTGIVPRGAVYNDLIKTAPELPRVLKDGTLSTAKDQNTTPDLYRDALIEHKLMRGGKISSAKHADCMAALLARGWDNLFRRFEPTRNLAELLAFERLLFAEYRDMSIARDDVGYVYPNPSVRRCPYCPVAPICQAMNDGSDAAGVIASRFRQKKDRKAKRPGA